MAETEDEKMKRIEKEVEAKEREEIEKTDYVKSIGAHPIRFAVLYIFPPLVLAALLTLLYGIVLGLGFFILAMYYLYISVEEVSNEEYALKKRWKTLQDKKVYNDGLFIFWKGIDTIKRAPTELIKFNFEKQEVITKDMSEKKIYRAKVLIDAVVSFKLPRSFSGLKALLIEAPENPDGLKGLLSDFIMGTMRGVLGKYSWPELQDNPPGLSKEVKSGLLSDEDNPMRRSRMTNIFVTIKLVKLPDSLIKAIEEQQNSIFKAAEIKNLAEAESDKVKRLGRAKADARRDLMEEIKANPEAAEKVMYEEMANGPGTTIFTILPPSVHEALDLSNKMKRARESGVPDDDISDELLEGLKYLPIEALKELAKKASPKVAEKIIKRYFANVK